MQSKLKHTISIISAAALALNLFACGKEDFDHEEYPEDMPFAITSMTEEESHENLFRYGDNDSVEYTNVYDDERGTIDDFLSFYKDDFSINYNCFFFFVNPQKINNFYCDVEYTEESFGAYVPLGDSGSFPYLRQSYYFTRAFDADVGAEALFSNSKCMFLEYFAYPIDIDLTNSEKLEFEFKSRKASGADPKKFTGIDTVCRTDIYINGYLVGSCGITSYVGSVTKYEVANYLYNNYIILSPETEF